MAWHTLDKPQTENVINAVRSAGLGELFAPTTSEVRSQPLPFYRRSNLYRLTNYATLPAFTLYYLGQDDNFAYLDGSSEVLERFNKPENLMINEETVLPYLDFYLTNVSLDVGEIRIMGERDLDNRLKEFPENTHVEFDPSRNAFVVSIPLYYDGSIMQAKIEVNLYGEVRILHTEMKMHGVQENNLDTDSTNSYY
jgi:hypothetical protein